MKLLCGFIKVFNEALRGNLFRTVNNVKEYCDEIIVFNDCSMDDTQYWLEKLVGKKNVYTWRDLGVDTHKLPHNGKHSPLFERELEAKDFLLKEAIERDCQYIFWLDGDEVLDEPGTEEGLRNFCKAEAGTSTLGYRFPEKQLWLSPSYIRLDQGFGEGSFIRLWRMKDTNGKPIPMHIEAKMGTHHYQFPTEIWEQQSVKVAPFSVIHYGNATPQHIRWKVEQYITGLGGWKRHLTPPGEVRLLDEYDFPDIPTIPLTERQKELIIMLAEKVEGRVLISMPTWNKAEYIGEAIKSVLNQTYMNWELYIPDDGSTDITQQVVEPYLDDPRISYTRYPENRGAVPLTNYLWDLACVRAEYWAYLGSDDLWYPEKLQKDVDFLQAHPEFGAVYAPYQVLRKGMSSKQWKLMEICNGELPPETIHNNLTAGQYTVGFANVCIRTEILKKIKEQYGGFIPEDIGQMNDFVLVYKLTRVAKIGWRDGVSAVWRDNEEGASRAKAALYAEDDKKSREWIERYNEGERG